MPSIKEWQEETAQAKPQETAVVHLSFAFTDEAVSIVLLFSSPSWERFKSDMMTA